MDTQNWEPTVLDLFSGSGGMSWGLHLAGFDIRGGIDEWEPALSTFKLNHPNAEIFPGDIRDLDVDAVLEAMSLERENLDVIIGGPPCQGFSKNVVAKNRFLDDERNQLFREFLRFVEHVDPKVVVMENVAEIYNAYKGSVREEIVESLEKLGYHVAVKVLLASDFGVPQRRRRAFFVASKHGQPEFPASTHSPDVKPEEVLFSELKPTVSAWEAISDLPLLERGETREHYEIEPEGEFQKWVRNNSPTFSNHYHHPLSAIQQARYDVLEPGQAIKDLPDSLRPKSGYSGAYGRLDLTSIAPTITRWVFHSGSGRFGHPVQRRTLTMREAARLQSFTDDFSFEGTRNDVAGQIGNAVPPLLMYSLASEVRRLLELSDTSTSQDNLQAAVQS